MTAPGAAAPAPKDPILAEDLLLLLFQPNSGLRKGTGVIAGENILFYLLAGAIVAELALGGHVVYDERTRKVAAVDDTPPTDDLLLGAWEYVRSKPRGVQTVLAAIGPKLREPVLARVIARGDLRLGKYKALGLFETTALEDGGTGRRDELLADVRATLVDGAEPTTRVATLAALLSGSGTLPQFHPAIPWTIPVITRGKELERGSWGAGAAAEAVVRTMTATVVNNVIVATTVLPRA